VSGDHFDVGQLRREAPQTLQQPAVELRGNNSSCVVRKQCCHLTVACADIEPHIARTETKSVRDASAPAGIGKEMLPQSSR
ncbi:MAG: hypothetical protein WAR21_14785, partial [Candidatus Acidiferrales bacterium]